MALLLNWRVWVALGIAAILAFTHLAVYRKGRNEVRTEWQVSIATANEEARRLERARQSAADSAGRSAAAREVGLRAAAAGAGDAVGRLRDAIATRDAIEQSAAAAAERAAARGKLLLESVEAYRQLAGTCDRHVNDLQLLLEAWPR